MRAGVDAHAGKVSFGNMHRSRVSPEAHAAMRELLQAWQAQEGVGPTVLPYGNDWFVWQRLQLIKRKLLNSLHCNRCVKSYLNSYTHSLGRGAASAAASDAEPGGAAADAALEGDPLTD